MDRRIKNYRVEKMENRAYIPQEAYQNYLQVVPTEQDDDIYSMEPRVERSIKVVQYEIDFDRKQAREILQSNGSEEFEGRVENFKSFTEMQLITALGERFNRGLSRYSYRNEDGILYGEHSDEPFLNVLERGRAYREINGNPIDHPREEAEVIGFKKIQEVLGNPDTPTGTIAISVSPPGGEGSIYKHNFYDGFQKKDDGSIEVVRFSNALSARETVEKLKELDSSIRVPENVSDVELLSNPFILSADSASELTLDKLHAHLHKEHDVMNERDFAIVQDMCAFLIVSYINSLLEDPDNFNKHARLYNAILNKADEVSDSLKENRSVENIKSSSFMTEQEVYYLGSQPVREVDTGCGFSGGMIIGESANGMFGVADFGMDNRFSVEIQDQYGGLEFTCPYSDCKKINKRPYGKLIRNCGEGQNGGCGRDVTC